MDTYAPCTTRPRPPRHETPTTYRGSFRFPPEIPRGTAEHPYPPTPAHDTIHPRHDTPASPPPPPPPSHPGLSQTQQQCQKQYRNGYANTTNTLETRKKIVPQFIYLGNNFPPKTDLSNTTTPLLSLPFLLLLFLLFLKTSKKKKFLTGFTLPRIQELASRFPAPNPPPPPRPPPPPTTSVTEVSAVSRAAGSTPRQAAVRARAFSGVCTTVAAFPSPWSSKHRFPVASTPASKGNRRDCHT